MKSTPLDYVLAYAQLILVLAAVYHKPLGLPDESDTILFLAAGVCLVTFLWRRSRQARSHDAHTDVSIGRSWIGHTWADKSKRIWLALAMIAPLALLGPFLASYTGSRLSFSQEVLDSVISLVLFAAIVWFVTRKRDP